MNAKDIFLKITTTLKTLNWKRGLPVLAAAFVLVSMLVVRPPSPKSQRAAVTVDVKNSALSDSSAESGQGMADPSAQEIELSLANLELREEETAPGGPVRYTEYRVAAGDMIGVIAEKYNLNQDTILSANNISNSRLLQIGQLLRIPDRDGILNRFSKGEFLNKIAERYQTDADAIRLANGMDEYVEVLPETSELFLPQARLSRIALQEINGDLFIWPVRGYISSYYGWRNSPFTGQRQFHSGLDIAASQGTPIKAAMGGRVSSTGYDVNSGNYVFIAHHSGYSTFYGHMDVIRVKAGQSVRTGQRIGDVGSTGLSTGSHVHFSVFKNGVTRNPLTLMN